MLRGKRKICILQNWVQNRSRLKNENCIGLIQDAQYKITLVKRRRNDSCGFSFHSSLWPSKVMGTKDKTENEWKNGRFKRFVPETIKSCNRCKWGTQWRILNVIIIIPHRKWDFYCMEQRDRKQRREESNPSKRLSDKRLLIKKKSVCLTDSLARSFLLSCTKLFDQIKRCQNCFFPSIHSFTWCVKNVERQKNDFCKAIGHSICHLFMYFGKNGNVYLGFFSHISPLGL